MSTKKKKHEKKAKKGDPNIHKYLSHILALKENSEVLKCLMNEDYEKEKDSVINYQDDSGFTALYYAVAFEKEEVVKFLLEEGADPNKANFMGMTPIFHATGRSPNVKVAKMLIDKGANVNHRTHKEVVPLHGACLEGNIDCIKLLISHGADVKAFDKEGTTPLDLAKDDKVLQILFSKIRLEDRKLEKLGESCAVCSVKEGNSDVKLRRCGNCRGVFYCSKECQRIDWKNFGHRENCEGYVIGYPSLPGNNSFGTIISNKLTAAKPTVCFHQVMSEESEGAKILGQKQFVVKVQIFLTGDPNLFVYNENKSVVVFISPKTAGYEKLRQKIENDGFSGIKGYFWAERLDDGKGGVKVYPSKLAPFQDW